VRPTWPSVAYISNLFPTPLEPYVADEICELRARGLGVIACSVRRTDDELDDETTPLAARTLYLGPLRPWLLLQAAFLCVSKLARLRDLFWRVLTQGSEPPGKRLRALLHTWLGAYFALQLKDRGVEHIHAHHGYFASWIAMVAARLLDASFSMTLHGSDLLLRADYLDLKLKDCSFCFTVSEFNRRHILEHYSAARRDKIIVQHLGVSAPGLNPEDSRDRKEHEQLILLAVGRLHPVKNHAFLIRACHELRKRGVPFLCLIAGEGSERVALERLIGDLNLGDEVKLLGHVSRRKLAAYYTLCDLAVLTSRSEGLPLVLMEAMAFGRLVLAPAITGIPELIEDGRTGFLYRPQSLQSFVSRIELIRDLAPALGAVRRQARSRVLEDFDRGKNLAVFADMFLTRLTIADQRKNRENPLLQQI
jgi:glycosyltransferase involved in cell wall biosynthesis